MGRITPLNLFYSKIPAPRSFDCFLGKPHVSIRNPKEKRIRGVLCHVHKAPAISKYCAIKNNRCAGYFKYQRIATIISATVPLKCVSALATSSRKGRGYASFGISDVYRIVPVRYDTSYDLTGFAQDLSVIRWSSHI